ncbi:MAG: amino acid adenylation domain-containing protein [Sulfuricella sp.]|nr:amino acid adenylation domain-containing protein [Sulfuricella sp.]
MMKKENLKDIYPLSPLQEGMLYHALFDEGGTAYVEQFSYRVAGPFDVARFRESWGELVARHDILRTAFVYEKTARPRQVVLKQVEAEFSEVDLRELDGAAQEATLGRLREEDRQRPFDPRAGHLARMTVIRLEAERHEVLRTHHHILMDGWSSGILLKELMEIYRAKVSGAPLVLPPAVPIAEYVKWVEAQDKAASLTYWHTHLDGAVSVPLPFVHDGGGTGEYCGDQVEFVLDPAATAGLEALAARCRVTLGTLCRAIWGILLGRYLNSDDVLFGAVVTGRPAAVRNVDAMVGLFINTIPVRIVLEAGETFAALLGRVQAAALEGGERQYLPLGEVLGNGRSLDHLFAFENFPVDQQFGAAMEEGGYGVTIERVVRFEHTHYDFSVVVNPGERLSVSFPFNATVYQRDQVERIAAHFRQVVRAVLHDADVVVDEIDVLPPEERKLVVETFNATAVDFPRECTLDELFSAQAAATPDNPALRWKGRTLTYGELNRRANRLARLCAEQFGVAHGDRVAVLLGRSDGLVLSFMAALKAGAAYVPIDPDTPAERIAFIVADCGAKVVVSDGAGAPLVPPGIPLLMLESIEAQLGEGAEDFPAVATPHSLAYVTYTSGSSGTPKGVMVEHCGAVNLAAWHRRFYALDTDSHSALFSSPAFDASVLEILPFLLCGACLYPLDAEARHDTELLVRFFLAHSISHCVLPPSLCEEVCRVHAGRLAGKIQIISGGDVLHDVGRGDIRIANNYGPTECTVVTTAVFVTPDLAVGNIPIGRPIDNMSVFLLDRAMRPVPIGVAGEMYIGGVGVARGYLNNEEQTREKFVAHPFNFGERLYRSGDLGRWTAEGLLCFLGRNDRQVKIRGNRVEPGEIEKLLKAHPALAEAAVEAYPAADRETELVAYYVARQPLSAEALQAYLATRLPAYMVPGRWVPLTAMPFTTRGKIDRDALPRPNTTRADSSTACVAARDDRERALTEIWKEVLGLGMVGIHSDFFAAGGHSLAATRVMSRIRVQFQVELPFRALFENPTIALLAQAVKEAQENPPAQPLRPGIAPSARRQRPPSPD